MNDTDLALLDIIWTTKDGTQLTLGEMDDNHLLNSTRMIKRQLNNVNEELNACWSCLAQFQGEMAIMYGEQAAQDLEELSSSLSIQFFNMFKVCKMRHIDYTFED
jgi:hypothetical protein